jgi:hypothetical protein
VLGGNVPVPAVAAVRKARAWAWGVIEGRRGFCEGNENP